MLSIEANDIIEGRACDFTSDGEGVVKVDGYAVFVPFAIKGELIRARVRYVKKDYAVAELIEVIEPSKARIKPRCPYFGQCGGCDIQHIDRAVQLELKRAGVESAIKRVGGLEVDVDEVVRLNDWEYRNKLALPFGYKRRTNRVVLGFYEKKTHTVVPMKWCPLHGEWAARLIAIVTEWANANNIGVYDESTQRGLLRHVVARKLDTLCVTLVVNGDRVPKLKELCAALEEEFEGVCVYVSENTKNTNVIFGKSTRLVYGIERKQGLGAFEAFVSPTSFLQVNNDIRDAIYDEVCGELKGFKGDILEFYSGVGLLTAQLAKRLPRASIISVEIEPSAVDNARALMKELDLSDRVECVCSDVLDWIKQRRAERSELYTRERLELSEEIINSPYYLGEKPQGSDTTKPLALILDPPRRGCDRSVLEEARGAGVEKIIYVSCNPQTLARDLKILSQDYVIKRVTPFDMFCQTSNVEVLCVLERRPDGGAEV